jgi:LmbE family N-acetylglucosaminyl deacetylase
VNLTSKPPAIGTEILDRERRVVTPGGHALSVWGPRITTAEVVSLRALRQRLGVESDAVGLLVLAAHPDDETLGCGRLMHTWSRRAPVSAVVATAGEACVDHMGPRPADIAMRRLAEWHQAMDTLGVGRRTCLDLPDGRLGMRQSKLEHALALWLEQFHDKRVVLAAPWAHDPHPDHGACGRAASAVAARLGLPLLQYPVWMTYWADPTSAEATSMALIRVRTEVAADLAHRRARAWFVSQFDPLRDDLAPVIPPDMVDHHHSQLLIMSGGAT